MNMRVEETYQMNVAVKVRVWGRGEKKGGRDRRKNSQRKEGLTTQHFWFL